MESKEFYDRFSEYYHLIATNWDAVVSSHGQAQAKPPTPELRKHEINLAGLGGGYSLTKSSPFDKSSNLNVNLHYAYYLFPKLNAQAVVQASYYSESQPTRDSLTLGGALGVSYNFGDIKNQQIHDAWFVSLLFGMEHQELPASGDALPPTTKNRLNGFFEFGKRLHLSGILYWSPLVNFTASAERDREDTIWRLSVRLVPIRLSIQF